MQGIRPDGLQDAGPSNQEAQLDEAGRRQPLVHTVTFWGNGVFTLNNGLSPGLFGNKLSSRLTRACNLLQNIAVHRLSSNIVNLAFLVA